MIKKYKRPLIVTVLIIVQEILQRVHSQRQSRGFYVMLKCKDGKSLDLSTINLVDKLL